MKVVNPHPFAVSIPNVADVAPGEAVDVPDALAASLLEQGWTEPAPEPKTPRGRKADAPKE